MNNTTPYRFGTTTTTMNMSQPPALDRSEYPEFFHGTYSYQGTGSPYDYEHPRIDPRIEENNAKLTVAQRHALFYLLKRRSAILTDILTKGNAPNQPYQGVHRNLLQMQLHAELPVTHPDSAAIHRINGLKNKYNILFQHRLEALEWTFGPAIMNNPYVKAKITESLKRQQLAFNVPCTAAEVMLAFEYDFLAKMLSGFFDATLRYYMNFEARDMPLHGHTFSIENKKLIIMAANIGVVRETYIWRDRCPWERRNLIAWPSTERDLLQEPYEKDLDRANPWIRGFERIENYSRQFQHVDAGGSVEEREMAKRGREFDVIEQWTRDVAVAASARFDPNEELPENEKEVLEIIVREEELVSGEKVWKNQADGQWTGRQGMVMSQWYYREYEQDRLPDIDVCPDTCKNGCTIAGFVDGGERR